MTVYYVHSDVKPGDTVHAGSDCAMDPWREYTQPITVISGTSYSDYSGSDVERSNARVMLADPEIAQHVIRVLGSHGYSALAYLGTEPPEPIRDALKALDDYPILDDDDHSALEAELESEAWGDCGRKEFRKALQSLLDELDPGFDHDISDTSERTVCNDAAIDRIWSAGCDAYNVNGGGGYLIETGAIVYFYIREWVEKARTKPAAAAEYDARYGDGKIRDLVELARLTRHMYLDPKSQESIDGATLDVREELRQLRASLQRGEFHPNAIVGGLDVRLVAHESGDLAIMTGRVGFDDVHGIACEVSTILPDSGEEDLDDTAAELVVGVVDQLLKRTLIRKMP